MHSLKNDYGKKHMKKTNFIYLASKSHSRQALLKTSNIPFIVIDQNADESKCKRSGTLQQVIEEITQIKMDGAIVPDGKEKGEVAFVLTSDTMGMDSAGEICGKPKDHADAVRMLHSYRKGAETGTAFCLDKRIWDGSVWQVEKRVVRYVNATYIFNVPDSMMELYFKNSLANFDITYMDVSGAVAVEDYGMQFVTNFKGSFTAVMGLPLYELREELLNLGFLFE